MRDLRDYWNWWKTRRSQIGILVILAVLLIWMNLELWQSERNYRGVLLELRRSYTQQEATRERQFARMLTILESHLSRLDVDAAKELKLQEMIREMLDPSIKGGANSPEHGAAKPASEKQQ